MVSEAEIVAAHNRRADIEARHARTLLRLSLLLAAESNPCRQLLAERLLGQAFTIGARRFLEVQHQLQETGSMASVRVAADGRLEHLARAARRGEPAPTPPGGELVLQPSGVAGLSGR